MSIRRNDTDTGWLVSFGPQSEYLDADYGNSVRAFRAIDQSKKAKPIRRVEQCTRSNKVSQTPVGITHYTVKCGRELKHRFAVCNPVTGKPEMVHIGNDNTYERNWERKLAEAECLREQFVEEHQHRH